MAFYLAIYHQLTDIIYVLVTTCTSSVVPFHMIPSSQKYQVLINQAIIQLISKYSCLRSHHIWGFGQFLVQGCLLWLPNRRIRLLRVGCYREVWSLHADKPGLLWSVEFLNTLTVFLILSLFCVIWFNWPCILWSWALTDPLSPDCHFHPEWVSEQLSSVPI